MKAIHNLKKRPSSKYLANRTVSFAAKGEIDHIICGDVVNITILTPTGETLLSLDGQDFLTNLEEKIVKKTNDKVFILRY